MPVRDTLGNHFSLEYGRALPAEARSGHGFPVFGSSGRVGFHRQAMVPGPGIIVGRKGTVGSITWSENSFWPIDTTYFVQSKTSLDLRWLYWFLRSLPLNSLDTSTGVPGLNRNDVLNLSYVLPPLPEQRRIAEILDTLDRTIENTQRIIEKLQATRQGLLHDLLTRGLDEHGQLRDPERNPELFKETELGKLPRVWEIAPMGTKALAGIPHVKTGPFGSALKGEHWTEDGIPVITIGSLGEGELVETELLYVSPETAQRLEAYRVTPGQLVFSRVADVGRSVVIDNHATGWLMSSNLMRLALDPASVNPHFFHAQLVHSETVRSQVRQAVNGGGREVANTGILNALNFTWPSLNEQNRIVAFLQAHQVRTATEQARLAKFQALKRGLMDDLLTGRVRVPVTAGEAVPPPAAPAPVAQQDAPSTIPFDRAPLAPVVNFRAAPGASSVAQADWVAQARTLASRQQPAPYSPEALDRAVAQLAGLSVDPEGILQVPDVLRQAGVRFVLLQHPKGSRTSGAAFWLDDACRAEPVVALSMRYPLVDVFWFNLFHELGHIRHGHAAVLGEVLEPGSYRGDDAAEREANAYAREALIPDAVWQPYLESGAHSSRGLRAFARQVGRHHATVAGRLGHDLRDFPRFSSRELRPSVPTEVFERLVLRLGGSV